MNGEIGRDVNGMSRTRSIVDEVAALYGEKTKAESANYGRINNPDLSASNLEVNNNNYPFSVGNNSHIHNLNNPNSTSSIINASKSQILGRSFQAGMNQNMIPISTMDENKLSAAYQQQGASFQPSHQQLILLQQQRQKQQQQQLEAQKHQIRLQQQQLRLKQLAQQQQQEKRQIERHNREYIGGAAAAAYNALRHDYYTTRDEAQPNPPEKTNPKVETSNVRSNSRNSNLSGENQQSQTPNSISAQHLTQGVSGFTRTDPRDHYELLKLHRINLLEEIQETSLMLNLYEQQRLQKRQEEMMRLKELEQKKALQIYSNDNNQQKAPSNDAESAPNTGRQSSSSYGMSSSSTSSQHELSHETEEAGDIIGSKKRSSPFRNDNSNNRAVQPKRNDANDDESLEESDFENDEGDDFSGNGDNDEVASFASDDGDEADTNYDRPIKKRDLRGTDTLSNVKKSKKRASEDDGSSENEMDDRVDCRGRSTKEQKKGGSFAQV